MYMDTWHQLTIRNIPADQFDLGTIGSSLTVETEHVYGLLDVDLSMAFEFRRGFSCILEQELRPGEYPLFVQAIVEVYKR
jgi:hypothetical protein